MPSSTITIQDALAAVMQDVREVEKTGRNEQQGFSFRGVDDVVNAVAPALRKHGVVALPTVESVEYTALVVGQKQTHMIGCRVIVTYSFVGPGADRLEARVPGEAMDSGDKATAKAMSVAFRTALLQALALPTDDLDPDAETYEPLETSSAVTSGEATAVDGELAVSDADRSVSPTVGGELPTSDPATAAQWSALIGTVGGSEVKALGRLNRVQAAAGRRQYGKTNKHEATRDEVAAAITGEAP